MSVLTTGFLSVFALKTDGTVWAWGGGSHGLLGDGTGNDSTVPVQVTGLTGVQNVTTTYGSVYAVKTDGTVWAWGLNGFFGQLGNGTTTTDSLVPVQVTGLTGVHNVVSDYFSAHAVTTDGTVWAWGSNDYGQLGTGTTNLSTVPVQVTGLTGVQNMTTAYESGYAVKTDGSVWAWGLNDRGQLGNGTTTDSLVPVQVG
ncbi:hypothetical protein ASG92_12925 [Arthrobacter sp. Soil736]|uniref:RCC1 domain-containing protein n=1 Tax=Arthrobacter sp. Soil736 TaxID=1736395 RepID=UPI0006F555F8|nr:hypothetical protein [Arthrobacter sp. Soil736]KRE44565.1 hypothetical protein ASG92_12925 [Arthrobacter sp. Soil736]